MYLFILAAAALALAAVLWCTQASDGVKDVPEMLSPEEETDSRLRRFLAQDPHMAEELGGTIRALGELMAHPELGGPGFLMVHFPAESGYALVTAQYPNIRETLYRRLVRREPDRDGLREAGVSEALLSREPIFETESGGVVTLSVQVGGIPPAFAESLNSRRERRIALEVLAEALAGECPQFSIRTFGSDLLLSPEPGGGTTSRDG